MPPEALSVSGSESDLPSSEGEKRIESQKLPS